jgi:hypothetical protein
MADDIGSFQCQMEPTLDNISYAVETKASPDLAWQVYSDWTLWPKFSDQYGEVIWTSGQPWEKGSRLRIEILRPVHVHVEHVIKVCVPAKRVSWIDHALGTTLEQWAFFEPLINGGTRVHTWAEFTGIAQIIAGRPIKRVIMDFIVSWYDKYRDECDRLAERARSS